MQFTVGQKIFGRSTRYRYRCDGGRDKTFEVEEYIIDKVGTKYIYARKEDWSVGQGIRIFKDSLKCKDSWREMEFFSSVQAMNEHDERESLFNELRDVFSCPNRRFEFSVEKLKAIKALLDGSNNLAFINDVHSLILAEEEKDTMDAILTMGFERVNPDKYPEVVVYGVIYKILNQVQKKG